MWSWIGRIAGHYNLSLDVFLTLCGIDLGYRADFAPDTLGLEKLSRLVRRDSLIIARHIICPTIAAWPEHQTIWKYATFDVVHKSQNSGRWIETNWCPVCLYEDIKRGGDPYFRKSWSHALVTTCHRHLIPLQDRCSVCGPITGPIFQPHKRIRGWACIKCGKPIVDESLKDAPLLNALKHPRRSWRILAKFEQQLLWACEGKGIDQNLFELVTPLELLELVDFLARVAVAPMTYRTWGPALINSYHNDMLDDYANISVAMWERQIRDYPNAIIRHSLPVRRRVLAFIAELLLDQAREAFHGRNHSRPISGAWLKQHMLNDEYNQLCAALDAWPINLTRHVRSAAEPVSVN